MDYYPTVPYRDCQTRRPSGGAKKSALTQTSRQREADTGCSCGFCDGVEIRSESVNPRTGSVQSETFTRMSRRTRCPICGGRNVQYRASYVAHVASLIRQLDAKPWTVRFLTVTLDRATADRAAVDGWQDSYKVLTGQRGAWSRAVRRMRRRDADLVYVGTLSARPSDGRAHAHVVLITRLSLADVRECVHVAGLDVHAKPTPPNESAAGFAASCAAYAFDNHAHAPSARFIASRGNGAGYDSQDAVTRRREAVERRESARKRKGEAAPVDGGEVGSVETNNGSRLARPDVNGHNEGLDGRHAPATGERAPPIECDGRTYRTAEEYERAVRRALGRRIGTRVHVNREGTAVLLKVHAGTDRDGHVIAEVQREGEDVTRWVSWSRLSARNAPRIRIRRAESLGKSQPDMDNENSNETDDRADDPVARFNEAARHSRVTCELPDGRRRVTVKDHVTGEVAERILPPRQR